MHLFSNCDYVVSKWVKLREYFHNLTRLTPQAATIGYKKSIDEKKLKRYNMKCSSIESVFKCWTTK